MSVPVPRSPVSSDDGAPRRTSSDFLRTEEERGIHDLFFGAEDSSETLSQSSDGVGQPAPPPPPGRAYVQDPLGEYKVRNSLRNFLKFPML